MRIPIRTCTALGLAIALSCAAHAASPQAVTVRYDHPENFTEAKESRPFDGPRESSYLDTLQRYVETRAARILAPGQHLDITITDVDRAGSYLPTATSPHPVRIVDDSYPPRIKLHFRLLDAQGKVIREGNRNLTDLAFMHTTVGITDRSNPLRYEENLIDRWLRKGPDQL